MISLVQRNKRSQSRRGTPSISAITAMVIGAEMSRTKSPVSCCAAASMTSRVTRATFSSMPRTARGVNQALVTRR
jgi:hypothetical protein